MDREKVYKILDGERDYQDERWENSLDRTVDEFALYIQRYANLLTGVASSTSKDKPKLDIVRKIGALAVACGEKHGLPERDE